MAYKWSLKVSDVKPDESSPVITIIIIIIIIYLFIFIILVPPGSKDPGS